MGQLDWCTTEFLPKDDAETIELFETLKEFKLKPYHHIDGEKFVIMFANPWQATDYICKFNELYGRFPTQYEDVENPAMEMEIPNDS